MAVALSVILGVALIAGFAWLANVEPLTRGHSGFPVRDPRVESSSRLVDAFGVVGLVNTVRVDPGTTFRYSVTIWNDGPLPVTIENVGDSGDGPISRRVVAFAANPYPGGHPRTTAPFSPFRLDPDQGAFIEMEVRLGNDACLDRSGFTLWSSEPVTYRILGITRHSDVETGHRDPDRGEGRADARLLGGRLVERVTAGAAALRGRIVDRETRLLQ